MLADVNLREGSDSVHEFFTGNTLLLVAAPPVFETGSYHSEIHEMTEMAVAGFGQYAQSHQPVHQLLWFHALAGAGDIAVGRLKRITDELYTPDRFPGDEDNGRVRSLCRDTDFGGAAVIRHGRLFDVAI